MIYEVTTHDNKCEEGENRKFYFAVIYDDVVIEDEELINYNHATYYYPWRHTANSISPVYNDYVASYESDYVITQKQY